MNDTFITMWCYCRYIRWCNFIWELFCYLWSVLLLSTSFHCLCITVHCTPHSVSLKLRCYDMYIRWHNFTRAHLQLFTVYGHFYCCPLNFISLSWSLLLLSTLFHCLVLHSITRLTRSVYLKLRCHCRYVRWYNFTWVDLVVVWLVLLSSTSFHCLCIAQHHTPHTLYLSETTMLL